METAGGGMHSDCGGCEGVVWRENQGAPILTIVVGCVWRAGKDIMPFEDVGLGGVGNDVWWGVLGDSFVFPC